MLKELQEILKRNAASRSSYLAKNHIEAYRLLHVDECPLPVAVDIYRDQAVIHVFWPITQTQREELEEALRTTVHASHFFYKNRSRDHAPGIGDRVLPASAHTEMEITEYGNRFHLNLSDYLDTGLFLDHRETRRWIGAQSSGKAVLNTFAYTGSFSVYAAQGGARLTHSVDLSKTYCEWIKKNLAFNGAAPETNWVLKMDTLEYFNYARRKKLFFDIIIIDPPTFSKNKGSSFSLQKDHPALINAALALLARPDGRPDSRQGGISGPAPSSFILFSNNYRDFHLNKAALDPCRVTQKIDLLPPDFAGQTPHQCFVITLPQ